MNKLIESIINKDYLTADKEFNKEISEKANEAINAVKREISENLLESKKLPMEERDDNENGVDDDKEQLDEISKETLGSYIKKANDDRGNVRSTVGWVGGDESTKRIIKNRTKGISRALNKVSDDKDSKDSVTKDVILYGQHRYYSGKLSGPDQLSNGYSRQIADRHASETKKRIDKAVDKLAEDTLNEAIEVDHSSYMQSHGSRAKGNSSWIISKHKYVDFDKHVEGIDYHQGNGKLTDVVREAAKKLKAKRLYPQP